MDTAAWDAPPERATLAPDHRSLAEWEAWLQMPFTEDGQYAFPSGLVPLTLTEGIGAYWEPNVRMLHETPQTEPSLDTGR